MHLRWRGQIGANPPISAFSKMEVFAKTKVVLIFSLSASPQFAPNPIPIAAVME